VYNNPSLTFSLELTNFATQQSLATGNIPARVAVADVNGDGKPDLIAAGRFSVGVLLNTTATGASTPTFATPQTFAGGIPSPCMAVADVNGDSKPDIVIGDPSVATVSELLNTTVKGSTIATFAAPRGFATASYGAQDLAVADVNGDGRPDLVVVDSWSYSYYS